MHFFGTFGTLSMMAGVFITIWVIGSKVYNIHNHLPVRDVVDQPIFFLALVAIIIGVQLFLAGFLAEMMIQTGAKKKDYVVSEKLGL